MKITFYEKVQTEDEISLEKLKIDEMGKIVTNIMIILMKRKESLDHLSGLPKGMCILPHEYFQDAIKKLSETENILKKIEF